MDHRSYPKAIGGLTGGWNRPRTLDEKAMVEHAHKGHCVAQGHERGGIEMTPAPDSKLYHRGWYRPYISIKVETLDLIPMLDLFARQE